MVCLTFLIFPDITMVLSQLSVLATVLAVSVVADKPAVAPQYEPAAPVAAASAPVYSAPAAPSVDTYGSPAAAPATDTYGSPQAPVDGE